MVTVEIAAIPAETAALRAGGAPGAVWLCSPLGDPVAVGRQFVASAPVVTLTGRKTHDLTTLERLWSQHRQLWQPAPERIPIAVGYLSYDFGHQLVGLPQTADAGPGFEFRFFDAVFERDEESGRCLVHAIDEPAAQRLCDAIARPAGTEVSVARANGERIGPFQAAPDDAGYLDNVSRVRDYLAAGDVYQVNLARRLTARLTAGAGPAGWALADRLFRQAPAPHALWMADLQQGGFLLGNSPERFLHIDICGRVETRPIKGTRARVDSSREADVIAELIAAPKDRAEHVMIVDLERNDLGRICEPGSVTVSELCRVLVLPTVYHLVSTVSGRLRPRVGLHELLAACFPGGSITGAPKRRAMQIIAELECGARGPYTGATGWLGAAGDLDLAVAIRTAVGAQGRLVLWVGGGIVIDSDPAAELAETETKARAFQRLVDQGG